MSYIKLTLILVSSIMMSMMMSSMMVVEAKSLDESHAENRVVRQSGSNLTAATELTFRDLVTAVIGTQQSNATIHKFLSTAIVAAYSQQTNFCFFYCTVSLVGNTNTIVNSLNLELQRNPAFSSVVLGPNTNAALTTLVNSLKQQFIQVKQALSLNGITNNVGAVLDLVAIPLALVGDVTGVLSFII